MQIATKRFLLRDFEPQDQSAFLAYHTDPRFLASYGVEEADPRHATELLERFAAWARETPRQNYQLAVVRQGAGYLVGCCGLRRSTRGSSAAELGIELAPDYWGRYAFALEIARALLAFGFEQLGFAEITGTTTSANRAVSRLAERLGAVQTGERPGPAWMQARGWTHADWHITRAEWSNSARWAPGRG